MAEKKVTAVVKLQLPAGKASAAPPVGSGLGPYGINIPSFVKDFNDIILSLIEQAEECYGKKLNDGYKIFLSTFYVDATAGILIDWVKDRNRHNREVYIEYIKNTLQNSLKGIFEACDGDGYPKNTEPTTAQ